MTALASTQGHFDCVLMVDGMLMVNVVAGGMTLPRTKNDNLVDGRSGRSQVLAPLTFGFLTAWLVGANVYLFSFYLPTAESLAILAVVCLYDARRWKRLFVLIPAATAIGGFVGYHATPAVSNRSFEIWTLFDLQSSSSGFLPLQNALIGASVAILLFTWLYWLSLLDYTENPEKSP